MNKFKRIYESVITQRSLNSVGRQSSKPDAEDPGIDNPDLYKHPSKYIDAPVLPYILKLWKANIKTYESGGDFDITEDLEDSDTPTPREYIKRQTNDKILSNSKLLSREYLWKNQLREKSFVIIDKENLTKARQILPKDIEVEIGTGGFEPREYNKKVPTDYRKLLFIQWKDPK